MDSGISQRAIEAAEADITVLDESTPVAHAVKVMKDKGISSVLVSNNSKQPVGIVTERDILYRVVAGNIGPYKATLGKVMTSPLVTADENISVQDAIILMQKKGIRRLPITANGKIVGMLTLMSLAGNATKIDLARVEMPSKGAGKPSCPYCQSQFEDKQELSRHIDRLHLGSGLLEGDSRQW